MTDTLASYSYVIKHYASFPGMYAVQDSDVHEIANRIIDWSGLALNGMCAQQNSAYPLLAITGLWLVDCLQEISSN